MKQKVVVKVSMNSPKSRSKAMKIAVAFSEVESAELQGKEKDQLMVVGDGIDVVCLTSLLRKRMGSAQLISVNSVDEKKAEKKNEVTPTPLVWSYGVPQYQIYQVEDPCHEQPSCTIL